MITVLFAVMLGSDSFATRETAHTALEQMGGAAFPALAWAAASNDPERSARASRLLDRLSPWGDNQTGLFVGSFIGLPFSDSLGCVAWEYRQEATRQLTEMGLPVGGPLWLDYRLGTKLWLEREGPADSLTLAIMSARSAFWGLNGRYP